MNPKYPTRIVVAFMVLAINQIVTMLLDLSTTDSLLFFLVIMSVVIFLTQQEDDDSKYY